MNQFARVLFVFLLASSLVIAQRQRAVCQTQAPAPVVTLDNLVAFNSGATTPAASSSRLPFDTTPAIVPPQGSGGSNSRKWGLIAGFAMVGTGAVLVGRKEPVHQTTCIAYDACPVPGLVRISGGMLVAVGASIILFKLKH